MQALEGGPVRHARLPDDARGIALAGTGVGVFVRPRTLDPVFAIFRVEEINPNREFPEQTDQI
jgi:hypothetical protein